MKKIFKKLVSGISAAALAVTTLASSLSTITASAAIGNTYIANVGSRITNNSAGAGFDAVYNLTLTKSGGGETLKAFCAGYSKSVTSTTYKEIDPYAESLFTKEQQIAISAVCYYGYATHQEELLRFPFRDNDLWCRSYDTFLPSFCRENRLRLRSNRYHPAQSQAPTTASKMTHNMFMMICHHGQMKI